MVHIKHNTHGRDAAGHKNDDESSKRPAPAGTIVELIDKFGPSKSCSNPRSGIDPKDDHAVLEGCDIGAHDVDNVQETDVADPVERVAGCISLDVLAQSFQDHADDDEENHQQEAFAAAADVDDLGDGELADTSDDGAKDGCYG